MGLKTPVPLVDTLKLCAWFEFISLRKWVRELRVNIKVLLQARTVR